LVLNTYIRKEFKNRWERRSPLTPGAVARLISQKIPIVVQSCDIRIFKNKEFKREGARLVKNYHDAGVVLGIKEPPVSAIRAGQVHLAFFHIIKGQAYNMGLLKTFLNKGATLIDYETILGLDGKRAIAFGRYAGIAGAVDTLYLAGQKLALEGRATGLLKIRQTYQYEGVEQLEEALGSLYLSEEENLHVVIVGTGNVGDGCRDVCHWMGLSQIHVKELMDKDPPQGNWYAVLETADIVAAKDGSPFDKDHYRTHGKSHYFSTFERYLGTFGILLQTSYWDARYPAQLTREQLRQHKQKLPFMIGDISCDIEGSLACTLKESSIEEPAFTYHPETHTIKDGLSWEGPSIMSIGHLPCELSLDASKQFSRQLEKILPEIVHMDLSKGLEVSGLSPLLQAATVVYKGRLTPPYQGLKQFL